MKTIDAQVPREAIGQSDQFLNFQEQLSRVARIHRPVLLIGERGTGKELAAARLHYLSGCWDGPFVTINCAALSASLLDSELFGHEAGAFTGAVSKRRGRFEMADSGSLFLDEIATLSLEAQEKMLRAVEYGWFERVGGSQQVQVQVRLIGATNSDLPGLAHEGKFKQDLLDRLSFEVLTLPPLRDREGDVDVLVRYFATRMAVELGQKGVPHFSDAAMRQLRDYLWPGNVRELKNVVERAVYRSAGKNINEIVFDPFRSPFRSVVPQSVSKTINTPTQVFSKPLFEKSLQDEVIELEKVYLEHALQAARFNQRQAAEIMGLTYHQFRALYRKHRKKD